MVNHLVRSSQLYKSADLYIDSIVSFDPVDRFWQLKCHFGVIFHGQSNYGDFKVSGVILR